MSAPIAHWGEVEAERGEAGHLAGWWTDLGSAAGSVTVGLQRIRIDPGKWSTPVHVELAEDRDGVQETLHRSVARPLALRKIVPPPRIAVVTCALAIVLGETLVERREISCRRTRCNQEIIDRDVDA